MAHARLTLLYPHLNSVTSVGRKSNPLDFAGRLYQPIFVKATANAHSLDGSDGRWKEPHSHGWVADGEEARKVTSTLALQRLRFDPYKSGTGVSYTHWSKQAGKWRTDEGGMLKPPPTVPVGKDQGKSVPPQIPDSAGIPGQSQRGQREPPEVVVAGSSPNLRRIAKGFDMAKSFAAWDQRERIDPRFGPVAHVAREFSRASDILAVLRSS